MSERRHRILAVDDEPDVLDVLRRALEEQYQVFTATSGPEALEILRREEIDLLITDQRMPGMSGVQLMEEARRLRPMMVRIILTGYTEPRDMVDAINRGEVYRYLTKPFDLAELFFTVRNGLEAYDLRRDRERLLRDLQLRLAAMTAFLDLSRESALARSTEEVNAALARYLPTIVDFDACVFLFEQERPHRVQLTIHCRRPVGEQTLQAMRASALRSFRELTGRGLAESRIQMSVTGELARPEKEESFVSELTVPVQVQGEPTGLIRLFSREANAFRSDTRELVDLLANQTSETIRNLREKLSAERQRLERMIESLPDGMLMVDTNDEVVVINPAARSLLKLTPDVTVDARYLKEALGFYPFDLVRGFAGRDGTMVREEVRVGDRVLHSLISPVHYGDKLLGVAVVLRDITEEKTLEQRKQDFLSVVSHELRTPLTSIGGALDLLLHRFPGEINEKQERYLQLAKGSCDKLNLIIDELLDLTRFEKGKMRLQMARLDLVALVREASENYQAAAQEKQVRLWVEIAGPTRWIYGDRNRLHQVLNNLLSNALKFTGSGGEVRVEVFSSPAMPEIVGVSVFNNGEEIEESDHERIFDQYEQTRRSRSGKVSGSGLGLSISKNIIEAHEGRIWVESGRGQGTRFIFTLPLMKNPEAGQVIQEVTVAAGGRPRFKNPPRVLVADDDPATALVIKGMLLSLGYAVTAVTTGADALREARERRPDLVLLDLRMPQIDGLHIIDVLRHDPDTRRIAVLAMSAPQAREEAVRAGAASFLGKPFSLEQLRQAMEQALRQQSLERSRFSVLVVDDDPVIRTVCREILEGQGISVREAADGAQALDMAMREKPDVVLLDVMLPDIDGFQVIERLREERSTAQIPIIIISARGRTGDKVRALRLGGDDYLVKPFDAMELGARVESVLKRREREIEASPTTRLPGSPALERECEQRLQEGQDFVLCYLDLDNLKAFNDYYGYAKADGVIQQAGDIIRKAVERYGDGSDLVSHIAGDDFVIVTQLPRLRAIAAEVIGTFDRLIPMYYAESDRERGYIEAEDRFGERRRFPLMSISLAAVKVRRGAFRSHAEVAARAAELKKSAKAIPGSVLVIGDERGEEVIR
jgi:DNA-binding response OmpR family regulator/signal transduction histidine kinase